MTKYFARAALAALLVTLTVSVFAQDAPTMPPRVDGSVAVDEHTAAPLQLSRSAEVRANTETVWSYLTDANNLPELFASIRSVDESKRGTKRVVRLANGGTVRETVVADDDSARTFGYAIADSNSMQIDDHLAVVTVLPADERQGSVVTWSHYFNAQGDKTRVEMANSLAAAFERLTDKFGGQATHGGNDGFDPATIRHSRIFNVDKNAAWQEIAVNFGQAHVWSSAIGSITVTKAGAAGELGDQRACFIPAFNGETKETIIQFDEDSGVFAYSVDQGLPPFVTYGAATWTMTELDRGRTLVTVEIKMDTAPGVPPQAIAFARAGMTQLVGSSIDEVKYYLERGTVHPRKIAAFNSTASEAPSKS